MFTIKSSSDMQPRIHSDTNEWGSMSFMPYRTYHIVEEGCERPLQEYKALGPLQWRLPAERSSECHWPDPALLNW